MLGYWDVRQALDKKYDLQAQQLEVQRQATAALAGLQGAQANEATIRAGLMPTSVGSETAFRDANTATIRAGLPFVGQRALADINAIDATTGLTKQRTVTEKENPLLIRSTVGVNNANARSTNNLSAGTGLFSGDFMRRYLMASFGGGLP